MPTFTKVAQKDALSSGSCTAVEVEGKKIAIFEVDGELCAIDDTCPHAGGSLSEGSVEGGVVTCPLHGWQFSCKDGVSPINPSAKVQSYNCKVEGNDVLVEL